MQLHNILYGATYRFIFIVLSRLNIHEVISSFTSELGFSCTFRTDFRVDAHRSPLAARSNEQPDVCKRSWRFTSGEFRP